MALETTPLRRARGVARGRYPDGWPELSAAILSRVRAISTPVFPIVTWTDDGATSRDDPGSRTLVSSGIATTLVRRVLQSSTTHAPVTIRLDVDRDRLTGVDVHLVCAYGVDLIELMQRIKQDVSDALVGLIGPDPRLSPAAITVRVVDVVQGDPNST